MTVFLLRVCYIRRVTCRRNLRMLIVLAGAVGSLGAGCGELSKPQPLLPDGGGGTSDSGLDVSGPSPDAGCIAVCSQVAHAVVAPLNQCTTQSATALSGGSIVDGTYVATSAVAYTLASAPGNGCGDTSTPASGLGPLTWRLSCGHIEGAVGWPPNVQFYGYTFTTTGSTLTLKTACKDAGTSEPETITYQYSATPTTVTLRSQFLDAPHPSDVVLTRQ